MTLEESSKQVKIIDKKIEQFAQYLQRKNNLDHIQFLKIRLGMQVLAINIEKSIVVYGLAIIFHTFFYTLLTHLSYFLIRRHAHGTHANSSLLCHIQNIILYCTIVVISLVTKEPVNKLILFGVILESLTLLPIFFPKEDINHGKHF